nr:aromatic amino acid ammonia-lyase [Natrinema versiforme]
MVVNSPSDSSVVIDGQTLTIDEIAEVARNGRSVVLSEDSSLRDSMKASVELRNDLIDQGVPLYGITTGFGDSVNRQISPEKASELQDNLIRFLGVGTGDLLPRDAGRAVTLVRANNLVRGHSAIRIEVVERLLELLNQDIVPAIPEEGSVGASGDLAPLSYIAAVLTGKRKVYYEGELQDTKEVMEDTGIDPIDLEPKEGLALVNGTAYMTGIAALTAADARRLALCADVCTALATEVLNGISSPFHPFLHDVAKPHDGQIRSARNIRWLLKESDLAQPYDQVVEQAGTIEDEEFRELSVSIQDKYSLRCAPHFIGTLWDALEWAEQWLETEINSSNDNPLFDVESEQVFSGGNFAGGHMALAMDSLRTAVASIGDLLDRQLELIVDEKFNHGLTPNLIPDLPEGHSDKGLNHGFKGMQLACSSITAEALNMCMPSTAFSRSTESHNQDKVSMGATAARHTRDVVELVEKVSSIHLLALCQAADLRGAKQLGNTTAIYETIREEVPPLEGDREMDKDIQSVQTLLRNNQLLEDLESKSHDNSLTERGRHSD